MRWAQPCLFVVAPGNGDSAPPGAETGQASGASSGATLVTSGHWLCLLPCPSHILCPPPAPGLLPVGKGIRLYLERNVEFDLCGRHVSSLEGSVAQRLWDSVPRGTHGTLTSYPGCAGRGEGPSGALALL